METGTWTKMQLIIYLFLSIRMLLTSCDLSMEQAARYLSDYGYLKTDKSTLNATPNEPHLQGYPVISIREGLKNFQKFAGLKPTGELDAPTKKKMQLKRCGLPDDILTIRWRSKDRLYKWDKNDLTYSTDSFPQELPEPVVRHAIRQAFDAWSAVTPLQFTEVSDNGDISVLFAHRGHGDPWPFDGIGGVLAHATLPPAGLLHFDADENWVYMNPKALLRHDTTDLLPVAIHEIGHVLGLYHSSDSDSIMEPFYKQTVDSRGNYIVPKLASSDISNIQRLYGSRRGRQSKPRSETSGSSKSSNGSSFWDRVKSFFGSSSHESSSDKDSDSGFESDHSESSDRDFNRPQSAGTCPGEVDAVITTEGVNYLFSNNKVYEFGRAGIEKQQSLKSMFPNGPPYVQGALSNPRTGRTLLFHRNMVFGYHYEPEKGKFVLEEGYPKRLPTDLGFKPMGAFLWTDGSQILLNGNHFATYDENWNHVTLRNEVENYFSNFPRVPIRGILINRTKILLFGNDKIYKYDRKENKVVGDATPLRTFLRCH